jgi:DNA adenine methylase
MDSPIPYFGGKSRLAQTIIGRIPAHKTYAEVFGGAAWILFKKPPSTLEALNDLDRHLMNFYRVAKHHPEALAEELAGLQPGREPFYLLREELDRPLLTDIQRAAAYYFIQRQAFAGRPGKPTLGTRSGRPVMIRAAVFRRVIPLVAERLKAVMLENLPWDKFMALYDSPRTFFFIDPPYMGHREYRHNFTRDDFDRLAAALKALKGRFLLTHTDSPEIRALFKGPGLFVEEVELVYTAQQMVGGRGRRIGHEVLITNYKP